MTNKKIQTQGALFAAVQLSGLFNDSKAFPDSISLHPPEGIEASFRTLLEEFISENFQLPTDHPEVEIPKSTSLDEHIDNLWNILKRSPDNSSSNNSSLISLPHPYVVPGGRFREIYYWDSYFTCVGLAVSGRIDLVEGVIKNFAYLIQQYGHIPNGNRTYYLSRSQPPFFWKMLQLLKHENGFDAIRSYLPQAEQEYHYWMNTNANHVVWLDNNKTALNRYWDESNDPREESYREDIDVFQRTAPMRQEIFIEIFAPPPNQVGISARAGWMIVRQWKAFAQQTFSLLT